MFRYLLRDILWLMVVVGVALGWGIERARSAGERRKLQEVVDALESVDVHVAVTSDDVFIKGPSFASYNRWAGKGPTVDISNDHPLKAAKPSGN